MIVPVLLAVLALGALIVHPIRSALLFVTLAMKLVISFLVTVLTALILTMVLVTIALARTFSRASALQCPI